MNSNYCNYSIYIPRMLVEHTELTIKLVMTHYNIGHIEYVDFTPVNKKPGFIEKFGDQCKSAFIHFMSIDPQSEFWSAIYSGNKYRLNVSDSEYWICLLNRNPVQRTLMNVHQIVESGRHLEYLIQEQEERINKLETLVYNLLNSDYNNYDQGTIMSSNIAQEIDDYYINNSMYSTIPSSLVSLCDEEEELDSIS